MAHSFIKPIDQGELLFNNLFSQYKQAPNFSALIQNLAELLSQDIENQLFNIYYTLALYPNPLEQVTEATGNQLDLAGLLIGLPRMAVQVPADVWQLDVTPFTGHKFGDINYLIYQQAPDDIYRDAILSYAKTITSNGDLITLLYCLELLMNKNAVNIEITQTATLAVTIDITKIPGGETYDEKRQYLVDKYITPNGGKLWPKVVGVDYTINFP